MQSAKSASVPEPANFILLFCIFSTMFACNSKSSIPQLKWKLNATEHKRIFQILECHVTFLFIEYTAVLPVFYIEIHFEKQCSYHLTIDNYMYWYYLHLLEGLHFLYAHNWKWHYGLVNLEIHFQNDLSYLDNYNLILTISKDSYFSYGDFWKWRLLVVVHVQSVVMYAFGAVYRKINASS